MLEVVVLEETLDHQVEEHAEEEDTAQNEEINDNYFNQDTSIIPARSFYNRLRVHKFNNSSSV